MTSPPSITRRARFAGTLLALLLAVCSAPAPADAQGASAGEPGADLEELWEQYPLEDGDRSPEPRPEETPTRAPAGDSGRSDSAQLTRPDDGSEPLKWLGLGAGFALLVLIAVALSRQPRPGPPHRA